MTRLTDAQKTKILQLSNDGFKPKEIAEQMNLDPGTVSYVKWSEGKKARGEDPFPTKKKKSKKPKVSKVSKRESEVLDELYPDSDDSEVTEVESVESVCEKRFGALLWVFSEAMFTLIDAGFEVKFEKPAV